MTTKKLLHTLSVLSLIAGLVTCAHAATINFDVDPYGAHIAAPYDFSSTTHLTDLYAPIGVHFSGSGAVDGGAIIDQAGNFGVSAHSGTNFFAFNREALMDDGGYATAPETVMFDNPIAAFSMYIAGGSLEQSDFNFALSAYDVNGLLVATANTSGREWSQMGVSWTPGISKIVFQGGADGAFVVDDMSFTPVPEPSSILTLICGISTLSGLALRRRSA